jgi:hypothetical protein
MSYTNDFYEWVLKAKKVKGWSWPKLASELHEAGYRCHLFEDDIYNHHYLKRDLKGGGYPVALNAYLRHVLAGIPLIDDI